MDEHHVPTAGKIGQHSASKWGQTVATLAGHDFITWWVLRRRQALKEASPPRELGNKWLGSRPAETRNSDLLVQCGALALWCGRRVCVTEQLKSAIASPCSTLSPSADSCRNLLPHTTYIAVHPGSTRGTSTQMHRANPHPPRAHKV